MIISRKSFIVNSRDIKHASLSNGALANIPEGIEKVLGETSKEVISLKEQCLRSAEFQRSFRLPRHLSDALMYPSAVCPCGAKIFTEAFMTFFYE